MTQDIKIGRGLGDIVFGMKKEELLKLLGKPSETELFKNSEEDEEEYFLTESWHYDDNELSVSFDEEDGWRLVTISTSNSNAILFGEKIINKNYTHIEDLLSNNNLGSFEMEEISPNQKVLTLFESSINFWFTNNNLTEIQWGVLWKNEDTPIWPI